MKNIRNMDVEWSYSGERGPEHWGTLCDWFAEGAAFPDQSPIRLSVDSINEKKLIGSDSITFHYKKEVFTEKEFKNTMHFVPPNTESFIVYADQTYHLTDIHFHTPAEHLLEEQEYPIEFHLVHMNDLGQNLVVGCLFNLTRDVNKFTELRTLVEGSIRTHEFYFDPSVFLPEKRSHFHYTGSLTTPPTKGPIPWFVFQEVGQMDRQLVESLKEGMLALNSRPLQDRKGRPVYLVE
ncbi:carbonic anhydrase family protein [Enterococcus sp. LJL51]|uniref:carbonic anhydrase family protein n=1 Tax=Enterococcus sp. LJL51 TaxID=3416656 RepID=UPI003CF47B10